MDASTTGISIPSRVGLQAKAAVNQRHQTPKQQQQQCVVGRQGLETGGRGNNCSKQVVSCETSWQRSIPFCNFYVQKSSCFLGGSHALRVILLTTNSYENNSLRVICIILKGLVGSKVHRKDGLPGITREQGDFSESILEFSSNKKCYLIWGLDYVLQSQSRF